MLPPGPEPAASLPSMHRLAKILRLLCWVKLRLSLLPWALLCRWLATECSYFPPTPLYVSSRQCSSKKRWHSKPDALPCSSWGLLHLVKKMPPNCSQNACCITKNKIAKSIPALKKEGSATELLLSKEGIIVKLLGRSSSSQRLRNNTLAQNKCKGRKTLGTRICLSFMFCFPQKKKTRDRQSSTNV